MKFHPRPPEWRRRRPAFTLIELLVVIAIIAILAALTMGTFSSSSVASSRNRTMAALSAITAGLEQYKEKFGEYPEPANPTLMGSGAGAAGSMRVGGALMLYQAITGDGNDQIRLASGAATMASDGKVDDVERPNSIRGDLPKNMILNTANGYMLIDGFGRPFQYEKGTVTDPMGTIPNPNAVNTTYDLWSIAQLEPGRMAGDPYSGATKRNAAATSAWIKNW